MSTEALVHTCTMPDEMQQVVASSLNLDRLPEYLAVHLLAATGDGVMVLVVDGITEQYEAVHLLVPFDIITLLDVEVES